MSAVTGEESIAAGVGEGIAEGGGRFREAAAWAWAWRSFDLSLPDVSGAAWQTDPVAPVRLAPEPPLLVRSLERTLL
ncbi:hypothetical protein [Streptomyces sp. H34-S4]|uniref:hypothetical protein n=1 Tax=Streptomyces sp. H34-S4 TaxID=2996463 RepID=UPI002271F2B3|nr:hypothetical protein [Streptomyces sp. H34-S4]MCY0937631.1 hypothetical protein [Streptomyces sp. H34-S4]